VRYARAHVGAPETQSVAGSSEPAATDTAPPNADAATDADAARPADAVLPSTASGQVSIVAPAIRIWLRHLVPLTLLSALALSPLIALALRARAPANAAEAKAVLSLGWTLIALAWLGQLVLVGGAAAMMGERRSQLRSLGRGFVQLIRAVVPCLVAAAAVAIGSLALVVPAPVLLVLLSLTGASRERGLPAPLADSVAAVRRQWVAVAIAVAALLALDAAIGVAAHRVFVAPLPAKPTTPQLAATRDFVRAIAVALVVLSPLPACILARLRARVG
jgi:hypothetical protein